MLHTLARPTAALILILSPVLGLVLGLAPAAAALAAEPAADPRTAAQPGEEPRPAELPPVERPSAEPAATDPATAEGAAAALAAEPISADPLAGVARLDLATTVAAVLERNPSLEAARRAWQAATRRAPQVSALPNPEAMFGLAPLSLFSSEVDPGASLEVRQGLPWPGKLRLAGEAADAEAEAVRLEAESLRLELALAAARLFYELYLVDLSLAINDQHIVLLEELLATATNRYAAGLAPQQAPLQAEVELTHLHHRTVTLGTARAVAAARLNALLHRNPALPLPPLAEPAAMPGAAVPGAAISGAAISGAAIAGAAVPVVEIDPESPPVASPAPDVSAETSLRPAASLDAAAFAARPEVAAAEAEVRVRELQARLAELERKPDFGVSAGYSSMWMETDHRVMLGVTVSLPVWRERLDAAEAEAEAARAAAVARRDAVADRVRADVRQALEMVDEMAHVVGLYQSRLLPASRDQVRAARTGFTTGAVDFPTVIEAEKNLRSVELTYQEARVGLLLRRAELDRALGRVPGVTTPAPAAASAPGATPIPNETATPTATDPAASTAAGGAR